MPLHDNPDATPTKQCSKCSEWKPATTEHFHRYARSRDGFKPICKLCRSTRSGGYIAPAKEGYKRCSKCREEFPASAEHFYRSTAAISGLASWCRNCTAEWRENNPDKTKLYRDKFYSSHPKIGTKYSQSYRKKNPGKSAEVAKRRYAADPEKHREQSRRRYAKNPQARIRSSRKHAMANPQRMPVYRGRIEARERSLPATLTTRQWEAILLHWNGRCAYCGNQPGLLPNMKITMDHFIPLSSLQCPGTVPTNVLPACLSCNDSKHNREPHKWLASKFGSRKAQTILDRLDTFFGWAQSL